MSQLHQNSNDIQSLVTLNKFGRTSTVPNEYSQYFIDFSSTCCLPVMDIGAAFGVASIPALLKGAQVTAVDLDASQLEVLYSNTPPQIRSKLTILPGRFPEETDFRNSSFEAVHASNLFNFLTGREIMVGLKKIFDWLIPGGKLFIISGSPYAKNIRRFIPEYEKRSREGVKWPGEIDDLSLYSDDPTTKELPAFIHLLDDRVLKTALEEAGFLIERIEMYKRAHLPDYLSLDGRENVGAVGVKRK